MWAKELEQMLADNPDIKLKEGTFITKGKGLPRKKAASVNTLTEGTLTNLEALNPYHHAFDGITARNIESVEAYEAALAQVKELFVKNEVNDVELFITPDTWPKDIRRNACNLS